MKLTRKQLRKLIKESLGSRINPNAVHFISGSVIVTVTKNRLSMASLEDDMLSYNFNFRDLRLHGLKRVGETTSTTINRVSDIFGEDGSMDDVNSYLKSYYPHILTQSGGFIDADKIHKHYNFDPMTGKKLINTYDKFESLAKGVLKKAIMSAGYEVHSSDTFSDITFKVYESDADMEFDEDVKLISKNIEDTTEDHLDPDFKREMGFRF